jgi:surfactin synthase thioesterase subunit
MVPFTSEQADAWLRRYPGCGARPRLQVLCFPPAGGGAASFSELYAAAGEDVACLALELPGHLTRIQEPAAADLAEVTRGAIAATAHVVAATDLPYVLLGQCFGAIVAFEVAAGLARSGVRPPAAVVVAGSSAPDVVRAARIADPVAFLRDMGGCDELLEMPALLQITIEVLDRDVALLRGYRYDGSVIDAPILALRGREDASVPHADLARWASCTRGETRLRELPGGHTFLAAHIGELLADLRRMAGGR